MKFVERMTARFFDWIPGTDGTAMARFLIRFNIPYRRTPANILYDTLTFATPYVAVPRMMAELKKLGMCKRRPTGDAAKSCDRRYGYAG